jgi:hypothetical protein
MAGSGAKEFVGVGSEVHETNRITIVERTRKSVFIL